MINAITYILENNATIQGLVGTRSRGTDYKVFPVVVPSSEEAPYIAVRQTGKLSAGKNCGHIYTVDVISYATSYDSVNALNAAVISALEGQASATINGYTFGYLNQTNESDDFVKGDHDLYAKISTFEGQ
jgi:hypothetical protein